MNHQPTYKKFEALSPQFSDVGKMMYDHWFHPTASTRYQREFSIDDISTLIEWMWHELRAYEAIIHDKDEEIKRLRLKK